MSVFTRIATVSPFGPIFGKELRVTARKKRSYLLRVGYLGLLLLALLMGYAGEGRPRGGLAAQAQHQAQLGSIFFNFFSMFCVIAMGLIGPVLTATAIGSERLAKTLPVLLMTPINAWQIIGGKLFSRLLAALTLIGLSLPVLALVRLLGGVELGQMLGVICICTTFVLSCAAIGLFYSTLMNRAYAVILLSYATLGILYMLLPFVLIAGLDLKMQRHAGFIAAMNPPMATFVQCEPRARMMFPDNWIACTLVHLGLATVLAVASALILRRSARQAGERPSAVNPESYIPIADVATSLTAGAMTMPAGPGWTGPLPPQPGVAPSSPPPLPPHGAERIVDYRAPGAAGRRPATVPEMLFLGPFWVLAACFGAGPLVKRGRGRDVSDNPVLWREVSRPLLGRVWQRITAASICAAILLLIYSVIASNNDLDDPDAQIGFAIIFHGLAWILVAVLSATAIAGEKESDTWTLLLATPVSGKQVVFGKVAGLCRRLLWPTILVVVHFLIFVLAGVIDPMSIVLMLWVMIAFNSVWLATGLYLSLRMKRVTFAVITNLMLAVITYAVPPVLLYVFAHIADVNDNIVENVLWYFPYYYAGAGMHSLNRRVHYGYGYNSYDDTYGRPGYELPGFHHDATAQQFFGAVFLFGCVYLLIAGLILWRTAASFDQIVGRAGKLAYVGSFDTDEAVVPVGAAGYAPIWKRFVAMLLDGLALRLAGATLGLITGFIALMAQVERDPFHSPEQIMADYTMGGVWLSFALGWPYYALFESSRRRATLGKSAMGIFVADIDGRRVSFLRATLRYFAKLVSTVMLFAGYALALFTPKRQGLHDQVAGTVVLTR